MVCGFGYVRKACLILFFAFLAGAGYHSAPAEELPLVRVMMKSGSLVGELQNEDETTLELFDFKSNRIVSVSKTSVTSIENPISLDAAAGYVGLPAVMGRKISLLSERQVPTGKIARIGTQIVYLTLGESSGVIVGQKVSVFRGEEDILDPDTGKVLATERARIADLVISEVNQNVSKARLIGDLEIKLKVGDEVEPQGVKPIVAICPLFNDNGSANPTGNSIAEELTTALVQRKVDVVERSALDMVLAELIAQNTILFDPKSAQQLGKLTGASMVLTGKFIQEKSTGTAHVRLIDVQTGAILLAVSAPVNLTPPSSTVTSTAEKQPGAPASTVKSDVLQPSGELEQLGKTRSLPKYLTTTSALQRTSEGGVRFAGQKKQDEYGGGIIFTRERNFLERNFIFEVLVTFGPDDGVAHIGIGTGRKDGSASRRADSLFIRFHAPNHGDAEVQLQGWQIATVSMGKVRQQGVHLVRMTKNGDSLTFEVDPENNGPSDDDMVHVIPNLREHAPYLNSKNCNLFLSGTGTFVATRLEILNGDIATEQPESERPETGQTPTVNLDRANSFGGTSNDAGNANAVDAEGNVYVTGYFSGTADFDPGDGVFNLKSEGKTDIFVSKLDNAGSFVWAKKIGGIDADWGNAIAVDAEGNVYTAGHFFDKADFDPGVAAFNLTSAGEYDCFVSKLDSAGNFVWAKRIGGINGDNGYAIALDGTSNLYTSGFFVGSVDFDPGADVFSLTSAGAADIFVSKLDSAGNFIWAKSMGGTGNDAANAVSLDDAGNVYTTGFFLSTADFDPGAGVSNLTSAGFQDIFVSKLDNAGNFVWAQRIGGKSSDSANDMAIDAVGNLYMTGYFDETVDFDPGAAVFNLTSAAASDIFVSKLDSAGNFAWARRMGGAGSDSGISITVDLAGGVYSTGNFWNTVDFDTGASVFRVKCAGEFDIYVSKLDSEGNYVWAKTNGGSAGDSGNGIKIDSAGQVHTTGYFHATVDFDPGNEVFNLTSAGFEDIFVSKLSPDVQLP